MEAKMSEAEGEVLTTLAEHMADKDHKHEYEELSGRNVHLMIMALFIPFCLFRGLAPFTTFMSSQQPWGVQKAANLNAAMDLGLGFTALLLPVVFVWEDMWVAALEMAVYGAALTALVTIHRFGGMWFHEVLSLGRMESGWSTSTLFLIVLAVLKRHPIKGSGRSEQKTTWFLLWIDFWFALSSISFVICGAVLHKESYRVLFAIWAGLLVVPLIPLYFAVPRSHYDPEYDHDTASSKKDCGKCCGGLGAIYSNWRSVAINLTVLINAFCMNVFLTDVGMHLRLGLGQNATQVGTIMLSYAGGSMIGHVLNRFSPTTHEQANILSGFLLLVFFATMASNRVSKAGDDSVSMVAGSSFFVGLSYQVMFYQTFFMGYKNETDSFMQDMGVFSCLLTYGFGAFLGDILSIVTWNAGGWNLVTTVLASCTSAVVVLYVLLGVAPKPIQEAAVVEEASETTQLLVGSTS